MKSRVVRYFATRCVGALVLATIWFVAGAAWATPPWIENRETLQRFTQALQAANGRLVRISVFGASHVAPDIWTGVLRSCLQRAHGDGGVGTFFPLRPFPRYGHAQIELRTNFFAPALSSRTLARTSALGRTGFALELRANTRTEFMLPESSARVPLEIALASQAAGGVLEVVRGGTSTSIDTRGNYGTARHLIRAHGRRVELSVARGAVRVLGFTTETQHGVVLEAFGVPSSRVRDALLWDADTWTHALQERAPDLVIAAYGTNEIVDGQSAAHHARSLTEFLGRVRGALPNAACWVVGPSDRPQRVRGEWRDRPRVREIDDAYRGVAIHEGCAYTSMLAFQGGLGGMQRWVADGLANDDHIHWSREGYSRFGAALCRELGAAP